jgi:cell division protein FtsB
MAYNITKLSSTSTVKKIIFLITIVASILIINSLVRSIFDLWGKQGLLVKANDELSRQKEENRDLRQQLSYVKSDQFIEEEARDKLFMVKPGESGVIVPQNLLSQKEVKKVIVLPAWQQWVNLFVGK